MKEYWDKKRKKLLNIRKLQVIVGMAGVANKEPRYVRRIGSLFQWIMLIIVAWLPIQWYLEVHFALPQSISNMCNWLIWAAFLIRALVITSIAKRKLYYLFTNWVVLVILIIGFPPLWLIFPILTTIKLTKILLMTSIFVKWLPNAKRFLSYNHLGATLIVAVTITFLCGLIISSFDPGFKTPFAGIWWAWQTVTSVGYGDVVPITIAGKLLGILMMIMGIALFSILTANFSAFLIGREKAKDNRVFHKDNLEMAGLIKELIKKVDALESRFIKEETPPLTIVETKKEGLFVRIRQAISK